MYDSPHPGPKGLAISWTLWLCALAVGAGVTATAAAQVPPARVPPDASSSAQPALVLREDFRTVAAHIPVDSADLTHPALKLIRRGPGASQLKLSFHPNVKNDPHYVWNGECKGPVLLGFQLPGPVDLRAEDSIVRLRTKNVGKSRLHLAVRVGGRWFVQVGHLAKDGDWTVHQLPLAGGAWRRWNAGKGKRGGAAKPDLGRVTALGFVSPVRPKRSRDCTRLDWFELRSSSARMPGGRSGNKRRGFFEPVTRALRTALVVPNGPRVDRTRRGVVLPLGGAWWACFDPDLLRWAAVWKAPAGQAPITLDSMAAVSYPDRRAKAVRPPRLLGKVLCRSEELPGAQVGRHPGGDPRAARLIGSEDRVGPLPRAAGQFLGVTLVGSLAVLRYRVGQVEIEDCLRRSGEALERTLRVGPGAESVTLRLDPAMAELSGSAGQFARGALRHLRAAGEGVGMVTGPKGTFLVIGPSTASRTVTVWRGSEPVARVRQPLAWPGAAPAALPFAPARAVRNAPEVRAYPLAVRALSIPEARPGARVIRPTDLAFLPDGVALMTTLDGDVWRIRGLAEASSQWRRVATGLFEPLAIETTAAGRVFVLGRDQVTELLDTDDDGIIDRFENRADGFLQTLHTRDFATSLVVEADGAFLIAKGGIVGGKGDAMRSEHRGTVLRLRPDGTSEILAEGLRLPFLARRRDGALFASDQQGHFVPTTPIHRLRGRRPFFGFEPMRQLGKKTTTPLVSYPYLANRSGAGFITLDRRGFPDLPDAFVHVSWAGRLFPVLTPSEGVAFSWRLPLQLDFPALNAAVHPGTGALYVVGLGISGYKPLTRDSLGLASVRQAGRIVVPARCELSPTGIQVGFAQPVAPDVTISITGLRVFDVRRSKNYGSGHFRWDGKPGEQRIATTDVRWLKHRRVLGIGVPYLFRGEVLELRLSVVEKTGAYPLELYARAVDLPRATAADLARVAAREAGREALRAGVPAKGRLVFQRFACVGCHSLAGKTLVGPPLDGIARRYPKGLMAHLRSSILEPAKTVTPGYQAVMPSYAGVIPRQDLEDLLAYLKTLR